MNKVSTRVIALLVLIVIISMSCRMVPHMDTDDPSQSTNGGNQDNSESINPEPGTPESSETLASADLQENSWYLSHQLGGNTYALAVIPGGHYALAGVGPRIVLLDLDLMVGPDGLSARIQNFMWQSEILPGVVRSISVVGNNAYVAAGKGHILIFDVSNPLEIQQISDLPDYQWAMSLVAFKDRLFVADNSQGLWVADITNPEEPHEYSAVDLKKSAAGLAYADPYIYLVDMSGGLNVYDLSDPADVQLVSHLDIPQMSTNIIVDGQYGYISAGDKGLWVVDVSDPTDPHKIAERKSTLVDGIAKSGDFVYMTDYIQGLLTYDVSRPGDPQLVNSTDIKLFNQGVPGQREMEVLGESLLIANQNEGVIMISLADPGKPVIKAKFLSELSGAAFDLTVQDSLIYVTRDFLGLGLVSLDPPEPFYLVSTQPTFFDGDPIRSAWKQAVHGNYVFQADMNRGLVVVEVGPDGPPKEIDRIEEPRSWSNVYLQGDFLFGTTTNVTEKTNKQSDKRSLQVVDISDPTDPQVVSVLDMKYNAEEVAIAGQYLYYPDSLVMQEVQDGKPQLHVIDISTPANPVEVNSVEIGASCPVVTAVIASERVLYVGDNSRGICTFDITNPQTPILIDRIPDIAPVMDLSMGGGVLLAASWSNVTVLDLADPIHPVVRETIVTPGLAYGVAYQEDGSLFVADTDAGLLWYLRNQ